ncbi:MAG TPA: serine/threonine-protein kinase, partial [Longimicrobiales bacterium]|nr:serine/threonine-protein kinase [Longimicrobiales bacterium]
MPPAGRPSAGDPGSTPSPDATGAGPADTPTPGAGDRYCPTCGRVFDADHRFCPQDGSTLLPRGAGADLVGRVVGGRYQALRKIGEGGMGQVYLARHLRIDRLCAVKVLHAHLTRDPESVGRFSREATTAARIRHPNVVEIHDCGEGDDGLVYIAMEWVEGKPLAQLLRDEGAFEPERATRLARQIAGALGAAHQAGIMHRDLKPDNILVAAPGTPEEAAKVVDFGIAKAVQGVTEALTRTGFVVGTPRYMSPEQLTAEPLDPRSDLYSLGCILFEMLTGQEAWGGGDALITRRLTEAPPSARQRNPAVPTSLDRIVLRLLSRSAEQRFQTAEELDAALAAVEGAARARPAKRAWLPWR